MLNLVFIGASKFGLRCLMTCIETPDVKIVGIVTAPETFSISYRPTGVTNVLHVDVATVADAHSIPLLTIADSMNDLNLFDDVAEWLPDAFLVAGWYHMIPKRWRDLAPAYGLHASLLPDYSGGAPLVWAMINGESKTGITLFKMDGGVDSGPVAAQAEEPIHDDDTIATLYTRIEDRGLELLRDALPALANNTLTLCPQDERKRRIVPQRSPEDGRIDWNWEMAAIDRFIRAQTRPYPGAYSTLNGKPITIWEAKPGPLYAIEIGQVRVTGDNQFAVGCSNGAVFISNVSYDQRNYSGSQLRELFGKRSNRLGDPE